MRTGTKSLLYGAHQFLWHPITVWIAWVWLYRRIPTWRETICIVVHDWGYFGKPNMDGPEGTSHPEGGAWIARRLLGDEYGELVLLHSRHYAKLAGKEPSPLCWADKLSLVVEPWWLYLPRVIASGEIHEYRRIFAESGRFPASKSHREWLDHVQELAVEMGREKREERLAFLGRIQSNA